MATGVHRPRPSVRWGRILAGTGAFIVLVLVAAIVAPISLGWDGVTFCIPVLGPVQRIDAALPDTTRLRVIAHERTHGASCERSGALRHYFLQATTSGRLASEAAAECAEARQQMDLGRPAAAEFERLVDDLRYGYPWFRRISDSLLRAALARACPDVAAEAAAQVPPWRRRTRP